jgi:hypothetical protein
MIKRNADCSCGSGKRFKHCCGAIGGLDSSKEVSDEQLLSALKRADDEHIANGIQPGGRDMMNIGKALQSFGIQAILMGPDHMVPEISKRARAINNSLFIPKELQVGGQHLGAFLFRDMFCQLYAPIAFGRTRIDFWKMIDLTDFQKTWLAEDPAKLGQFTDQAMDVLDFGFGWHEFGTTRTVNDRSKNLIWRSHSYLEAAAATAIAGCDYGGTVQSAHLGVELALKAGLAANGVADKELAKKTLGHNLPALTTELSKFESAFDYERVGRVVAKFPDYVESRYNLPTPTRIETGHILMGAQYVASEVTRRFSDRNGRKDNPNYPARQYPT